MRCFSRIPIESSWKLFMSHKTGSPNKAGSAGQGGAMPDKTGLWEAGLKVFYSLKSRSDSIEAMGAAKGSAEGLLSYKNGNPQ